ncbi:MAG: FtsQ-type POTRA domain-containing protein [Spirulina sp. SIO3F2]|nr:FtsQ-type POTRA domain-containing protein [Spirulina sp. SIO3F2]
MTGISSVSSDNLKVRRQSLKRRRQTRIIQAIWRSLAIAALSGGMIWFVTRPNWMISDPAQVTIKGNTYLSDAAIRSLLPVNYPQPLLNIRPQLLRDTIQNQAPIETAIVTRGLFPPSLTIEIVEHQPVAIALPGPPMPGQKTQPDPVGLVDAQGFWMPQNSYIELEEAPELPNLTVVGLSDETRHHWPGIYHALSQSTLKIFEIDLRSPHNIVLKTELGTVHFGPYLNSAFAQQLRTLAQMRKLPDHVQSGQVDYIDLRNPNNPAVQLKIPKSSKPLKTS